MNTSKNTNESEPKPCTIEAVEAHLRNKFVVLTHDEWRAYKRSALLMLAIAGIGTVSTAWLAVKRFVDSTAYAEATRQIQSLKLEASTDAAAIAELSRAMQQGEFFTNVTRVAVAVESLLQFNPQDCAQWNGG